MKRAVRTFFLAKGNIPLLHPRETDTASPAINRQGIGSFPVYEEYGKLTAANNDIGTR